MLQNNGKALGGLLNLKQDGVILPAKGDFEWNLGLPKAVPVMGSNGQLQGFSEEGQPGYIKGEITDYQGFDILLFLKARNATFSLELANGKTVVLRNAFNGSEGAGESKEGKVSIELYGNAELLD